MEIIEGAYKVRKVILGTGGGATGDLMVATGTGTITAVKAAAAPAAGMVLGILLETGVAGELKPIAIPNDNTVIRAPYAGSTKQSLANTDIGTVFDLSNEKTVNLDDTTGGIAFCQGYNNASKTIDFVMTQAAYYM